MSSSFLCACSFVISAEIDIQFDSSTETRGANLCELNLCGEIFSGEAQDGEHVDLALFQLLPTEFYRVGAAGNCVTQGAFALTQIVIVSEGVFHLLKRAQGRAHVAGGGGFLLGGAKILRSLKFTTEKDRLGDASGQTPNDAIERADGIQLRCSESASGAEDKARQPRGASFVHPMKCGSEAALARD